MTERRKLKKTVRERMDRTGEAYVTAHRNVTARAKVTAPGGNHHRESTLVRRLLARAGVELSEAMVCGLGGGIGFMYAVFEYAAVPHPLLTIVAQHHPQPWAAAVADRLGVSYQELHSSSTAAALAKLRRELDGGRPVLCTVDRSRLPWHSDVPTMAAADPYGVVVVGTEGGTLLVDDGGPEVRGIGAEQFGAAWAGHRKGRYHQLTLIAAPDRLDVGAAVRDAVATTVAHLTGPVLGNSFDVNFGFSGMAKLAAELRATSGRTAWSRRFGEPDSHAYAMKRLEQCLQREYTAPDATRPLYADFLAEAATTFGMPALAAAGALVRESAGGWAAATTLARDSGRGPRLHELAGIVDGCLAAERAAVKLLTAS